MWVFDLFEVKLERGFERAPIRQLAGFKLLLSRTVKRRRSLGSNRAMNLRIRTSAGVIFVSSLLSLWWILAVQMFTINDFGNNLNTNRK